ncbi:MAG: VanZ family protein [Candidatus Parvarchaeota archaeon]|nr:VanZ family protein [Candidatus Jingweiarchaeum tengchongense]MCW1297824.1 VanZ family protein [Candidatus Jingweiarchaeum tengchongense]MCW1299834.1 VanZ family protein [Candidatus Jingweiarchaeum tengchongense]MCW1304195.1 VanZ family protein [Candidatus Jingweiarchaeum tengchongense]MCW1305223.1 VanZ family protein [Candidatus Jingweiarchaeum tengchongense]
MPNIKFKYSRNELNYTLIIIYMLIIFYLSSIPLDFPEIIDLLDPTKFSLHVIEYSILGFLIFNAKRDKKFSILIGFFYALTDEIHQSFVPYRIFSFFDLIADFIGVYLGIILFQSKENFIKIKFTG